MSQPAEPATDEQAFERTPKKAALSGFVGSSLEYYDFFIYAQAAALVFPQLFFPSENPTVQIASALATFGVGYVARPVGAFFMGHYGDKHGRKKALVLCMLMMGTATTLTAFLPTYEQVGPLAPVLLVTLRLVQGFAVSGELAGANAMIFEHSPDGRRGFFTSFSLQGTQGGQLIAAAVFVPLPTIMSDAAFESWGWRLPFLMSFVVMIAGFVIRRRLDEPPSFRDQVVRGETAKSPVAEVFRTHKLSLLRVFLMAFMNTIPVMTAVFGAAYATQGGYDIGMDPGSFLWVSILGNAAAVLVIPFIGGLSDRDGRRRVFVVGAVSSGVLSYLYLYFISQGNVTMTVLTAILMWGILYQGYNAVFPAFYLEQFPTQTRVTAFAVAQNAGTAVTAFIPTIYAVVAPPGSSSVPLVVGSITFAVTLMTACVALTARETAHLPLALLDRGRGAEGGVDEMAAPRRH